MCQEEKKYWYVITKWLFNSTFLKKKYRSSHWRCSVRKGALKNFTNFTGKQLCWSLFLLSCQPPVCKIFKKRFQHSCEEHLQVTASGGLL